MASSNMAATATATATAATTAAASAPKQPPVSPTSLSSVTNLTARRDSLNSLSVSSQTNREQLSQALDKIHNSASQSGGLTTFSDFGPPPATAPAAETKGTAGDLVQQGLSGLYSRFKEAVGVVGKAAASEVDDTDGYDAASKKGSTSAGAHSKHSAVPLPRGESGATSSTFGSAMSSDVPTTATSSSGGITTESNSQAPSSSKASSITTMTAMTASKSTSASAQNLPQPGRAAPSAFVDPSTASGSVSSFKDSSQGSTARSEDAASRAGGRRSIGKPSEEQTASAGSSLHGTIESRPGLAVHPERIMMPKRSRRDDSLSLDGSSETALSPVKSSMASPTSMQGVDSRPAAQSSSRLSARDALKKPAVIDRITGSRLPGSAHSRSSSMEPGTAEPSPISTSAHNSVYHESFAHAERPEQLQSGEMRIPGTTVNEGAPEAVSARLELMRKQVLSKEFWMADETCNECFLCGDSFSAFRRKHHCRTCGCIFDSKCTSTIPGQRFGVPGNLRVCKTCLDIINRRYDSASDESPDEGLLPTILRPAPPKAASTLARLRGDDEFSISERAEEADDNRSATTPMMAIPATRRIGDPSNRNSAILEIDAPQLSRPSSSRSLKSLASGRPQSSGHKRHHSKHNFLGRFKAAGEERAPFRKAISDEMGRKSKLPAFHDDNIIDPELAPYMSEESSGDEQMSIFATIASSDINPSSLDPDKTNFGSFLTAGKKHRLRQGDKSISGMSFTSRGLEEGNGPPSTANHPRPMRRRNMSTNSGAPHYLRSPRPKSGVFKNFAISNEALGVFDPSAVVEATKVTRSNSIKDEKSPEAELGAASLRHVKKLYRQLLQDADIPNPPAWEKAIIPILIQCADDVDPDTRNGDHMDIRHYVKLKKIPGGRPADTSYVSGVIFTKNLALKSMPRSIANPRIVIISFPIEYQRQQQQHFMSLQPVIEQEKEYLRVVVNRIINLRPQVLLAAKSVAGVALQYLTEANIAVVYNVKASVIEAVSRCAKTEIISSLDMLALPVMVGQVGAFEVKTFVNNDIPGKKKTYIFISGCDKALGCTIGLRGASTEILHRMKRITEFMVYVVYNLKLESCLMRDEYIKIPGEGDDASIPSTARQTTDGLQSTASSVHSLNGTSAATASGTVSDAASGIASGTVSEKPSQADENDSSQTEKAASADTPKEATPCVPLPEEARKLISLHESHARVSHESQVPEDLPAPTFYSDMVAKYETKVLSASPFVKFSEPYLLMRAREQERRLLYLKRLRDQDIIEERGENEKAESRRFQLIKPEMVHELGQKAPRQIMEVIHAVHDAEYDRALYNYQTQTRQWENHIHDNIGLFDPFSHQNIVVLYSMVCTETKIPCIEPGILAIPFYDELPEPGQRLEPDCTLGQYVQDFCSLADEICHANGCDRPMWQHHRTYVHGEARITMFVEPESRLPTNSDVAVDDGEEDDIFMWSYCKICRKELAVMPMSNSTWKYSFGKYLELSFLSRGLQLYGHGCPHDHQKDHIRYFYFRGASVRVHYDPIELLEIVVPRARITWKVDHDLRLKNEIFTKTQDRWVRFINSVKARIKSIRIDSVLPEKMENCKSEVERLAKKAQEDHPLLTRELEDVYMSSKYYEIIPLNAVLRRMLEKVAEWDAAFAKFEADFLSDKDVRQLTMIQLRKMFTDNESRESLPTTSTDGTSVASLGSEPEEKAATPTTQNSIEDVDEKAAEAATSQPTDAEPSSAGAASIITSPDATAPASPVKNKEAEQAERAEQAGVMTERVESLDLATPASSALLQVTPSMPTDSTDTSAKTPGAQESAPTSSSSPTTATSPPPTPSAQQRQVLTASSSLSEKVEQLRREFRAMSGNENNSGTSDGDSKKPSPEALTRPVPERGTTSRRAGLTVSPPLARALSQPVGALPRTHPARLNLTKDSKMPETGPGVDLHKISPEVPAKVDKKLSERIGLNALKNHRKAGQSSIPRYVHKKKDTKVSTLARHFEQLSREFEKERMRDRKQRAAKMTNSRAFLPRSTTKATVVVYDDVDQAVREPGPSDDDHPLDREQSDPKSTGESTAVDPENVQEPAHAAEKDESTPASTEHPSQQDEAATEVETDDQKHGESAVGSDDEAGSDVDQTLEDILPDVETIAEHLEPSGEVPSELQKDKKSNLMKMLTNFWAERSASGWPQLEYPLNVTDHIFIDSDIIVREDEPSSLIAFALGSEDYNAKLCDIRRQWKVSEHGDTSTDTDEAKSCISGSGDAILDEEELESSLLRETGTHLKYQFVEGSAKMLCKIFYAEQFDALRRKCGVADRIIESLSRCLKWDSKGGKTKSVFLKTLDDRLVMKSLSPIETSAFLRFAPAYFSIMAEALFHELPSVIAKMLGFFQVIIKNPVTGTEIKLDLLVMENLFYDRSETRKFDLKGSMRNRKVQSTGEQNEVLLDENMVEYIYESPLFVREHAKKLLRASVWNDTLFLARQNVMDYSLMIAVDESRKELVIGIIDCIRTYTWDKKLESWIKDRGFAGGGRNRPTVTSPKEYKSRFREAMERYILQAPDSWYHFGKPGVINTAAIQRARLEAYPGEE